MYIGMLCLYVIYKVDRSRHRDSDNFIYNKLLQISSAAFAANEIFSLLIGKQDNNIKHETN